MGLFAGILGGIGALAAIIGIITALEIIEPVSQPLTWQFWFSISAILFLATISLLLGNRGGGD